MTLARRKQGREPAFDPDLREEVDRPLWRTIVAALVGFGGVVLLLVINWLAGGQPTLLQYLASALAVAVVEATVLGTGFTSRAITRIWALREQATRNDRRALQAPRDRVLVEAEIEEDDR